MNATIANGIQYSISISFPPLLLLEEGQIMPCCFEVRVSGRMIVCLWLTAPRCVVHQLGYLARIFSNNGELVPCFL